MQTERFGDVKGCCQIASCIAKVELCLCDWQVQRVYSYVALTIT